MPLYCRCQEQPEVDEEARSIQRSEASGASHFGPEVAGDVRDMDSSIKPVEQEAGQNYAASSDEQAPIAHEVVVDRSDDRSSTAGSKIAGRKTWYCPRAQTFGRLPGSIYKKQFKSVIILLYLYFCICNYFLYLKSFRLAECTATEWLRRSRSSASMPRAARTATSCGPATASKIGMPSRRRV